MTFLGEPEMTPQIQAMYDDDLQSSGYVMNVSRLWAHQPEANDALFALIGQVGRTGGLSLRERGILVTACASTLGDSYCSLAWGNRLARASDGTTAAGVLTGDDDALDDRERALTRWARQVARDRNGTTATDVEALRDVGYDDGQVQAITTFVALRLAFSTVNDALGAVPDDELRASVDPQVNDVVTWGR